MVPWSRVEATTTKKTALKIRSALAILAESANVAKTMGAAPRNPAQPIRIRSRGETAQRGGEPHGQRPDDRDEQCSQSECWTSNGAQLVRENEQTKDNEESHLGQERQPLVKCHDLVPEPRRGAPDGEANQVDGNEAAAADKVGRAECNGGGRDRGDWGERPYGFWEPGEQPRRPGGEGQPHHRAQSKLTDQFNDKLRKPGLGMLDP